MFEKKPLFPSTNDYFWVRGYIFERKKLNLSNVHFIRFSFYFLIVSTIIIFFALWRSNTSNNFYLALFIESLSIFLTVFFVNFGIREMQKQKEKPVREEGVRRALEIYGAALEAWEIILNDTLNQSIKNKRISKTRISKISKMANHHLSILDKDFCQQICGELTFANSDVVCQGFSVARIQVQNLTNKIDVSSGHHHSSFSYVYSCIGYCKESIERNVLVFSTALPTNLVSAMLALERCYLFDMLEFNRNQLLNPEERQKSKEVVVPFNAADFASLLSEIHSLLSRACREFTTSDAADALLNGRNTSMKKHLFQEKTLSNDFLE